jgi:glutathione synthase/RimK-type ligase-like ATP-grasp enzyme
VSILFVTEPANDGHFRPVLRELIGRGREVQIFDPGVFPEQATITVDSSPSGPRAVIRWENQTIDLSTVGSIWYRRPANFNLPTELASGEVEWLRGECSALVRGLYANTDALWVSAPHKIRHADLKLLQLRLAHQLGFQVPDYTVTNDPERARAFLAEHPDGVIVKGLWMPTIQLDGRAGMIYTHLVTPGDMDEIETVRFGPTFLQALVPKARDIRVTVIGDQIFAAGIDSMTVAESRIDFRKAETMDLPHEPVTLPDPVANACLAIVKELGLQFGAIDLLETPEGDYVFLENNPNGQWYWVEMMTGQPMAKAMADLLERGEDERGRKPSRATSFHRTQEHPRVLALGDQTVPLSVQADEVEPSSLRMTATRAWLEKKRDDILLHVGDTSASDEEI